MQVIKPETAGSPLGQVADADLRLLRVFQGVVECGGMAAAERQLNLAVSTISRHIKDLETRLGLTLCRRGRGGFALTPEGERIYAEASALLAATNQFRSRVDDIRARLDGELRLALFEKTASNPAARVAEAIALFRRRAPGVDLNLTVGTITAIERGVIDGQFHVGLVPEHSRSDSLRYLPLFGETMLLYAGRGHRCFAVNDTRLDWEALAAEPLAGLGYHSPNMHITSRRGLRRHASGSDQEAVATLVLSGEFLGFLPDHYAAGFVAAGRMRAVNPAELRYDCTFSAIVRRAPAPLRITETFLECLQQAHGTA